MVLNAIASEPTSNGGHNGSQDRRACRPRDSPAGRPKERCRSTGSAEILNRRTWRRRHPSSPAALTKLPPSTTAETHTLVDVDLRPYSKHVKRHFFSRPSSLA
jgi:hypothetical protein